MQTNLNQLQRFFLVLTVLFFTYNNFAQTSPYDVPSSQNFVVPANVYSITVQCWGGGAGGINTNTGGGGGGGAYTTGVLAVTPGQFIWVQVGPGGGANSAGQNSYVSTIIANGGNAGSGRNGGDGGAASAITGGVTASFSGGNGGNGRSNQNGSNNQAGGGGGGSAFFDGDGNDGSNGGSSNSTATAGGTGTGAGGVGAAADGNPGSANGGFPGGGGGGRGEGGSVTAAHNGANGRVIITWIVSNPEINLQGGNPYTNIVSGDTTPTTTEGSDFGAQLVASGAATRTFRIQNLGTTALTIGDISFSGAAAADFSVTTAPSSSVAANGNTEFIVTFNPSAIGTREAIISIINNDVDENPYTFSLTGIGTGPEINIQGGSPYTNIVSGDTTATTTEGSDFGAQLVASGAVTRTFRIQNSGTAALTIGAISFSGAAAIDFSVTTAPSSSVAVSGNTEFIVTFNPSTTGTREAVISIINNDDDENPYTFSLIGIGTGPEINIQGGSPSVDIASGDNSPTTAKGTDFGSQSTTGTVTRTFTIQNLGNTALSISTISFSGTGAGDYSVSTLPAVSVAVSGSTTFVVTFDPSTTGTRNAILSMINGDDNENPYTFSLTGVGVAPVVEIDVQGGNPSISIVNGDTTPSTSEAGEGTDFGSQNTTSGYILRTFTILNTGNGTLTLSTPTISLADYSIATAPALSVAAGASTNFTIKFDPTTAGTKTANVVISNNDSNEGTYTFRITGIANTTSNSEINIRGGSPAVDIPINEIARTTNGADFGAQYILSGSVVRTFTIQNTGTASLTIGAITFTGDAAADYTVTTSPSSSIAAGGSSTFNVTFDPSSSGNRNVVMRIVNNDPNENPYTFNLKGIGNAYLDSDGDGVTDEKDIDDDNDGIRDIDEQSGCVFSPFGSVVETIFLNETFGSGTTYTTIDANIPTASTDMCWEDGNTGTGTTCSPNADSDVNDGEYTIRNTAQVASWAASIWHLGTDHTGDTNGKMAIINANNLPSVFYTTIITGTVPNVPLTYSFWVLNLDRSDNPNIGTRVRPNLKIEFRKVSDNSLLTTALETGNIPPTNPTGPGNWQYFASTLTTSETSFKVVFTNLNPGGLGNDLALDDILIKQRYCDYDNDGTPDIFDLDSDNDGIPDITEAGFINYSKNNANTFSLSRMNLSDATKWKDFDGNGLNDDIDALISGGTYNSNYLKDTDGDGIRDFVDLDSDNDSIFDIDESNVDNFSAAYNGDGDIDGDGKGDGDDSADKDGILSLNDDTVGYGTTNKAFPSDRDNDGIFDFLDTTSDGSSFDINETLYKSLDANSNGAIDSLTDADKDGVMDTLDGDLTSIGAPRNLASNLLIDFDGRNDYAEATQLLSGLQKSTIMGWIKLANPYTINGIILGQDNFSISVNASRQLVATAKGTTTIPITFTTTPLAVDRWYHVAAVYEGSATKKLILYLNGEEVASSTNIGINTNLASSTAKFTIAKNALAANTYFKGFIDEVRVFNVALSKEQLSRIICQKIDNNGGTATSPITGSLISKDMGVNWDKLLAYFRMDNFKDDVIDDYKTYSTIDSGTSSTLARIYNVKYLKAESAPMPFTTRSNNDLVASINNAANYIVTPSATDLFAAAIIKVSHNVTCDFNLTTAGLIVDTNKTFSSTSDTKIENTWYLDLQGKIDLVGKSQLIQTTNSTLAPTTTGSIERDQQGTKNIYNYNYWSSPVSAINHNAVNNGYTVGGVMKDGTTASFQDINWSDEYDGVATSPITISRSWIYKYQDVANDLANWSYAGETGDLGAGQGFTLKGSGANGSGQNYTFVGKPNNGTITTTIAPNNLSLIGNPYPSSISAFEFIKDNISPGGNAGSSNVLLGTLYFWEHAASNDSHNYSAYKGGYAARNLIGGIPPVAAAGTSGLGGNSRQPELYIPIGQAFFVKASATGGNITFKNSQRGFQKENGQHSNIMFRASNTTTEVMYNENDPIAADTFKKIRIGFDSNENFHRQLLLGFMDENAGDSYDPGYDAENFDNFPSDMYFINEENNLIIQGVGSFVEANTYPLGVKSGIDGIVTFTLDETENIDEDQNIYIYDAVTEIYHDIKDNNLQISLATGTYSDRFSLRFTNQVLGIDNPNANSGIQVTFTNTNETLTIENNQTNNFVKTVSLFNILGQQIYSWDIIDNSQEKIEIPIANVSAGTYIAKIATDKNTISKKIVIR